MHEHGHLVGGAIPIVCFQPRSVYACSLHVPDNEVSQWKRGTQRGDADLPQACDAAAAGSAGDDRTDPKQTDCYPLSQGPDGCPQTERQDHQHDPARGIVQEQNRPHAQQEPNTECSQQNLPRLAL